MNMEYVIDGLKCRLNHDHKPHLIDNPKLLPCCGKTACNSCILNLLVSERNSSKNIFNCPICRTVSKIVVHGNECKLDFDQMSADASERYVTEVNHYLLKRLESAVKNIDGMIFLIYFLYFN